VAAVFYFPRRGSSRRAINSECGGSVVRALIVRVTIIRLRIGRFVVVLAGIIAVVVSLCVLIGVGTVIRIAILIRIGVLIVGIAGTVIVRFVSILLLGVPLIRPHVRTLLGNYDRLISHT
jgi:hypothetical protein